MLILPPGHAQSVRARRPLSRREKRFAGVALAAVAALLIAVVVSLVSASPRSRNGCIYVTQAAATGGEEIDQCGAQARYTCQSARASDRAVASECRKAGLPVG